MKMFVYMFSGFCAAIVGLIITSQLVAAHPATGETFELNAIAAAVLGGTSMSGGRGRIGGTIIGAFVIGILADGLVMMGGQFVLADGDQGAGDHRRGGGRPGAAAAAGERGAAPAGGGGAVTVLRGGLIGCGFFAANHLNAWRDVEGAEIVALCDRDAGRLAETAARFGIARTYGDAAEMLAAEGLDFVDIATTVASHRPLVELAAGAGVHMVCQKPFAGSMADARAMVAAVEAAGRVLMVHENFRWQAAIRRARR